MTLKSNTNEERSPLDVVKLLVAAAILVGGVIAFYWYEDVGQLYRTLGMVAVVLVAAGITLTTTFGRSVMSFARDSRTELRKVVWPTRQETLQTTLVVLVMVLIVAIFLWLLDMLLLWVINGLTGIGG